ncbi:D-alanyl-D-alanine carboxypeptidase/D-alanyl-D-alanine-endopeptidase [bacterium]|nr:D-alanyl-D-alanine carboxypeptidase/D-alanyl-D-alanine-endopeptidase [bacterium]
MNRRDPKNLGFFPLAVSATCAVKLWQTSLMRSGLVLLLTFAISRAASAENNQLADAAARLMQKLRSKSKLGVVVTDLETGNQLFKFNADQVLMPASVMKIVTSVAALKYLGSDYKIPTEVFSELTPNQHGAIGSLYIRGYGDPLLDTSDIEEMSLAVSRRGVREINDIVVDNSLFVDPFPASGAKAYQAGTSALTLNQNTLTLEVYPGGSGERASVYLPAGSPFIVDNQVQTSSRAVNQITVIETGVIQKGGEFFQNTSGQLPTLKISGKIGGLSRPASYRRALLNPEMAVANTFAEYFRRQGIKIKGQLRIGATPGNARLIDSFEFSTLADAIREMNHTSNNVVANQLLFALGQDAKGYFRSHLGIERIHAMLAELECAAGSYAVYDGSGLSKKNRITASCLSRVLRYAYHDFSIAPDFIASFSRFGHTGTLRKRKLRPRNSSALKVLSRETQADSVWAKTGTLAGVTALAGYATTGSNRRVAFVILSNSGGARSLENEIVKLIIGSKI